ncbi:MAG: DUF3343 domain-containing protein [Ruminococcaceae bacterium]|nr:DUF3343 domain-containing protein [Oscillospiraceae bacterium]
MRYCFITFNSLTAAQRAESILRRSTIRCSLQRSPRWMEEQGCGNGLRVDCEDLHKAVNILRGNRILYKRAYLRQEDGAMEELRI